jgi:CxxC motif-containing protein (DUF1111 family)
MSSAPSVYDRAKGKYRSPRLTWNVLMLAVTGLLVWQVRAAALLDGPAHDPGVRLGAPAAGGPIAGLTADELEYFLIGKDDFVEEESVSDGLGPRMNLDSCAGCHTQPEVGGSSPPVNPQVAFAGKDNGSDAVPPFITENGPVREARFVANADGTRDGGVHALFTINGRSGATDCGLAQPDFATQLANNNVIFRIPTPIFGAGLIEQIPDAAILANRANNAAAKSALGIRGRANFHVSGRTITGQTNNNGNDGTIARFGWKAQNKSLLVFSGEAYNVEMGITNELFQTERDETPQCQYATTPNSVFNLAATTPAEAMSSIEKFTTFMRFLAPPQRPPDTASTINGSKIFNAVGCALCHTPSFTTGNSKVPALRYAEVNLYSDLLVHDMGVGLADGISQGEAGPREFRTAPLWGLGQRIFFLHDGRTSDLLAAIRMHRSTGSEANGVLAKLAFLTESQKQDLLNFLRSL